MLSWVQSWVRQIAVVVILAGVVELVVPRGTTRGYVRVVTGLLVMLTILEPFMYAIGHQVSWTELEAWPDELEYPGLSVSVDIPSVQEDTRRLTLEAYRQKVVEEIRGLISRVEELEVVTVALDIETRPEHVDYGSILAVMIAVRPAATSDVEPVRPISADAGEHEMAGVWPPELEDARREILDLLRLHFDLSRDQVQLSLVEA